MRIKILTLFILLIAGFSYAEIVGKVESVSEFRGLLIFNVKYYDNQNPEVVLSSRNIVIANNDKVDENINKIIKSEIRKLKQNNNQPKQPKVKEIPHKYKNKVIKETGE